MLIITKIDDVAYVLSKMDHQLAQKWLMNDMIKKNLAISYDYWLEDTAIPMTLEEYVEQYLENAPYLEGIFSADLDSIDPG